MNPLFKKLNLKDQKQIFVLNHPDSFNNELKYLTCDIQTKVTKKSAVEFAIGFAITQNEVDTIANTVAPQLAEDGILWIAYPKGSSKKYTCDFNRDTGFQVLGQYNLEPVKIIAIDEDWSALRFRNIKHIKNFTRSQSMALSKTGKEKAKK